MADKELGIEEPAKTKLSPRDRMAKAFPKKAEPETEMPELGVPEPAVKKPATKIVKLPSRELPKVWDIDQRGSGVGKQRRQKIKTAGYRSRAIDERNKRQKHSIQVKAKSIIKPSHGKPSPRPNRKSKESVKTPVSSQ